jgi:zinc transport system substrate-binding protein
MRARIVPTLIGSATLLLTVASAAGCGDSDDAGSGRAIVAAFYPIAFAAQEIAPDADVANLTPAGAEPHDLELTAKDVEGVRDADLVLYLGSGFMPALEAAVGGDDNTVDLLEGVSLLTDTGGENTFDPHVWLDPMRYATIAERIGAELGEPGAASTFVAELESLDDEFRRGLEACDRRTVVTSHAAFGYLADAYDLEQIALTGLSPDVEPSAKALQALVDDVEEQGATTVFFETLVSPDLAETVAREASARTAVLNPLEGLTEDEVDAGAVYFSVMREHLAALRAALGCS